MNTDLDSAVSPGLAFITDYNLNDIEIGACAGTDVANIVIKDFTVWGEYKNPQDIIQNRFRTYANYDGMLLYMRFNQASDDVVESLEGSVFSLSNKESNSEIIECPSYKRSSSTHSCKYSPLFVVQNDDFQLDAPDLELTSQFSIEFAYKIEGGHISDVILDLSNNIDSIFTFLIEPSNTIRVKLFQEDGTLYLDKTTALISPILTLTQFSLTHSEGKTAIYLNGVEEDSDLGVKY